MRSRPIFWFVISMLCMAGAFYCWRWGDRMKAAKQSNTPAAVTNHPAAPAGGAPPSVTNVSPASATQRNVNSNSVVARRLANTSRPLKELLRDDNAILLENALIDSTRPLGFDIPPQLRLEGEPGSYLVKLRGPVDAAFHAALKEVGAEFVSYIPNNAALVRASSTAAGYLQASPLATGVIPWEPVYKLKNELLALGLDNKPLPFNQDLTLVLFGRDATAVREQFRRNAIEVTGESRSPFGAIVTVRPPADWLMLARMPEVQSVELSRQRVAANDLTRVRLGITPDTVSTNLFYLGLTGSNVVVNVNDSGVDATHPDLAGRVNGPLPIALTDVNGHGTHVAGTIASSGAMSSTIPNVPPGSVTNASFRGMAPGATILSQIVLPASIAPEDYVLQETAARTNALISNNSWNYVNANTYDIHASSFDQAVRDSLPERPGSQAISYVFAAGNIGGGNAVGLAGLSDSILSPATAKNVITVGAAEQFRDIQIGVITCVTNNGTNVVCSTNLIFRPLTDNPSQIASFSSRGNVGVGIEGEDGRFKPDVVAPGTFVISTRSQQWDTNAYYNEIINAGGTNSAQLLQGLNDNYLSPFYRFETGTSMAAPAVSGLLALIQEYFSRSGLPQPSPALKKALVINGARTLGNLYDFDVKTDVNHQGWGQPNIQTILPSSITNFPSATTNSIQFYDQSPETALATGEERTRTVSLTADGQLLPMRITLVWTDPPGNPVAGVKLVNDLDLVVTDNSTGDIYYGNDISTGRTFNTVPDPLDPPPYDFVNNVENVYLPAPVGNNLTVTVRARRVNVNAVTANTNNIVQDYALVITSGNGEITNAFTIASSTANTGGNTLDLTLLTPNLTNNPTETIGAILFNQHVGANSPILGSTPVLTNGQRSQWHFYVYTNATTFTNVRFVTLSSETISVPQIGVRESNRSTNSTRLEADIDLYVHTNNSALFNLDANAIETADKSRGRLGFEFVIYSNSSPNQVYYVGVKAEDQMGGEYGILAESSLLPFDQRNPDGSITIRASNVDLGGAIPDGDPLIVPNRQNIWFYPITSISSSLIRRLIVTNELYHENLGDLVGYVSSQNQRSILNNHRTELPGDFFFTYEDNGEEPDNPFLIETDGPGKLTDFIGIRVNDLRELGMVDNANSQTGRVSEFSIRVEPSNGGSNGMPFCIQPNAPYRDVVEVPVGATNLTVCFTYTNTISPQPVELYLKRGSVASVTNYDHFRVIFPPGDCLVITPQDLPPLQPGLYHILIQNPNATVQCGRLITSVGLVDIDSVPTTPFNSAGETGTFDDAVTNSTINVTDNRTIQQVEVGVRLQHPRVSDLALTLVSPLGTRVLLTENRGGLDPEGFGGGLNAITNVAPTVSAGGQAAKTNDVQVGATSGFLDIDYNFFTVPDFMRIYYDGLLIFDTGLTNGRRRITVNFGPGSDTFVRIVMNEGNNTNNPSTAWQYTVSSIIGDETYLVFTENTNRTTTPMKFLTPPYTPPPVAAPTNICNFDTAATGSYVMTQSVDGWTVQTSNRVAVFNEPGLPLAGNSFALLSGSVERTMTNKLETNYRLNFAYRKAKFLDGLISWWPGESNAVDVISTNNGTLTGGATYGVGNKETTFAFDGLGEGVNVGNPTNLQLQNFTIEAWVKRTDTNVTSFDEIVGPSGVVFAYGTGGYGLSMLADGRLSFSRIGIAGVPPSAGAVTDTNWHHVAFTKSNTACAFYIDGVAYPVAAPFNSVFTFTTSAAIGTRGDGAGNTFFGRIDELAVFNRALTPFEIADIFAAGEAGKCGMITPPDLCPLAGATVYIPNGPTNSVLGTTNWSNSGLFFTAGTNTTLRITPTGGGRTYELIRSTNSWGLAQLAAMTQVRAGMRGHLATITSAAELEFVRTNFMTTNVNEFIWIGGREPADDGVWKWDAGPEVGRQFSQGNTPTAPYNFVNWAAGQPDNSVTNENYLAMNIGLDFGAFTNGQWVDTTVDGGGSNAIPVIGYLVEYEPPNSGVYFDNFTLTELADALYVLPENSLDILKGENAQGTWKLEVLDRRTGATNIVSILRDWQLRFIFELDAPAAVSLKHGIPHTNSVPTNSIAYYIVDVPPWALFATNQLLFATGGSVNLLFNQTTPPTGFPPDTTMLAGFTGPTPQIGNPVLATNSVPPLQRGQRYYLGVQNTGATTVNFAIQVDFDITQLFNAAPQTNTLGLSFPKYYFFDVSTNATAAQFRLYNMNGNANLIARRGLPLPTLLDYSVGSFNAGNADEDILLFTNSQPVALAPGRWYLGVYPADIIPVNYTIVAEEFTNDFSGIITLTNRIPYANTNLGPGDAPDYYRFSVSNAAVRAQFEINNPSGDMTLLLRKGLPLPSIASYHYASANVFTNDELIVLYTNTLPVRLSRGDWFLTALNISGGPVTYSIKASEYYAFELGAGLIITNYFFATNSFCMTWTSLPGARYYVEGKPDLAATNWTIVSPTITATDYSTTWCLPLPSPYQYFRVAEGIVLSSYSPPINLNITNTPAGMLLTWTGGGGSSFNVQWSPTLAPPAWTSFTNVITSPVGLFQFLDDGTQTGGLGSPRFYRLFQLP